MLSLRGGPASRCFGIRKTGCHSSLKTTTGTDPRDVVDAQGLNSVDNGIWVAGASEVAARQTLARPRILREVIHAKKSQSMRSAAYISTTRWGWGSLHCPGRAFHIKCTLAL